MLASDETAYSVEWNLVCLHAYGKDREGRENHRVGNGNGDGGVEGGVLERKVVSTDCRWSHVGVD